MDAAVWGFVGVVAGSLLTLLGQWLNNRHAASLDSARREDDRLIARERQGREWLVELQDLSNEMLLQARAYRAARDGSGPPPIGVVEKYASTGLRMRSLASRAHDPQVAQLTASFLSACSVGLDESIETARALVDYTGPLIRATFR